MWWRCCASLATVLPQDPGSSLTLLGPLGPQQLPGQTVLWAIVHPSSGVFFFLLFKFQPKVPISRGVPASHLGPLQTSIHTCYSELEPDGFEPQLTPDPPTPSSPCAKGTKACPPCPFLSGHTDSA